MSNWFWFILVTLYGACIGSFLNVVIYRVPEGKSLIRPGSYCPKCNTPLALWDNVPVLAWLWLRGKCRYCKVPISVQYPIVEALVGALFATVYLVYYHTHLRRDIFELTLGPTWPVLVVHLVLVSALFAATVIDWRLYIIPLVIPWTAAVVALVGLTAGTCYYPQLYEWPMQMHGIRMVMTGPAPRPWFGMDSIGINVGAVVGLVLANVLLAMGVLTRSFDDDPAAHDEVGESSKLEKVTEAKAGERAPARAADGEAGTGKEESGEEAFEPFALHAHPRREVMHEVVFLLLPCVGALVGWKVMEWTGLGASLWKWYAVRVLMGSLMGLLVGGALIWFIRILGTLAFGREAMGLGDVHLLAAIGAALGPLDATLVFFVAPFLGLGMAIIQSGISRLLKGKVRVIPYGPYLAAATLVVMFFGPYLIPLAMAFSAAVLSRFT